MKTRLNSLLGMATIAAGLAFGGTASAIPIITIYNFVPTGTLIANTGDVTNATTITSGAPDIATAILADNTGLIALQLINLTSPTPVSLGSVFTKSWTTALGTFTENLTVTLVTPGPTSLGILATGFVTSSNALFDSTPVFYSAAYTQNAGPQGQINASFNNSTIPPQKVPEPASAALVGLGVLALGLIRRRRHS